MEKYSKVIERGTKKFRYNYEECVLEFLTMTDYQFVNDEFVEVALTEPMVADAVGLSVADWEDSNEYWVDRYIDDLEMQLAYEVII